MHWNMKKEWSEENEVKRRNETYILKTAFHHDAPGCIMSAARSQSEHITTKLTELLEKKTWLVFDI